VVAGDVPGRDRQAPAAGLPGVSIVFPVRDESGAVAASLGAAAAQDYAGPMEIVVADGSAGPATADAARRALPSARIVPNPGRSAAAGMNRGVEAAAHALIVRCDARCALPPDYVRLAVAALARSGAVNVGGRLVFAGRTPFERAAGFAMSTRVGSGGPRYRTGGPEGPVDSVPLGAFRRDALAVAGGFDEAMARNEDYELNWRLRRAGGRVWFDPALSVSYQPRSGPRALARQYFDYGRWKRETVRRHPRSVRARHLAAPLLVLGLGASALVGAFGAVLLAAGSAAALPVLAGAASVPASWTAALLAGASGALRRRDMPARLAALALAVMHLAWGAGFLAGRATAPMRGASQERGAR
jgi:GT2 family glycosyltransferase